MDFCRSRKINLLLLPKASEIPKFKKTFKALCHICLRDSFLPFILPFPRPPHSSEAYIPRRAENMNLGKEGSEGVRGGGG